MKKSLQRPLRWLGALLVLALHFSPARASHIQGGQINYAYVGPGAGTTDRYRVTVSYFRDCTGIGIPATVTLQARRGGCTAATVISVTLAQTGAPVVGTPYCGRIQAAAGQCTSASPFPNYQYANFSGTVDLQPAPLWVLSVEDCCRPDLANLGSGGPFRLEARLNSLIITGSGTGTPYRNNSPVFSANDLPVPYLPVNQLATVSFATTELDGDSLVYSLEQPLAGCDVFNPYVRRPNPPCVSSVRNGCTFVCPDTLTGPGPGKFYTAQLPLAVAIDTTVCANGTRTLRPRLNLDAATGLLTFFPNRFIATPPADGDNKYAVVCNIKEYRRLATSNRRVLVGSVRRDFLVTIVPGVPNTPPLPPVTVVDSTSIGAGVGQNAPAQVTRLTVSSCNFSQVNIRFTDPDNVPSPAFPGPNGQGQLLTVTYTGADLAQQLGNGAVATARILNNGTISPTLQFAFQPDPSFIGRIIRLSYRIEDDNCPLKGVQVRVIEINVVDGRRVRARAAITSPSLTAAGQPVTICPGGAVTLAGTITAVDSIRQSVGGRVRTVAQTYQYRWFAPNRATAGLPSVLTGQTITVRPTVTTRYTLFANPNPLTSPYSVNTQGFSSCGDSTSSSTGISVLVRVVPEPVVTITPSATQVCAGTPVNLGVAVTRADGIADTYAYRWSGPGIPANTTSQNLTVTPSVVGLNTYSLTATGDVRFGCDATKTVQIEVVPPPVVTVTAPATAVCAGNSLLLSATATRPTGPGSGLADTYTYQWSGPGVPTTATGATLTVTPAAAATYRVAVAGNPQFGCVGTAQFQVTVAPNITASFVQTGSVSSRPGSNSPIPPVSFSFNNTSTLNPATTGFQLDSVRWTYQRVRAANGDTVTSAPIRFSSSRTVATTPLLPPGYYRIRLAVNTRAGGANCPENVAQQEVFVPSVDVPNVITPNGDNLNDVFVVSQGQIGGTLEIYNRWGRKLEELSNYRNTWGGEGQGSGVYYYFLTDRAGNKTKGWVEVVK